MSDCETPEKFIQIPQILDDFFKTAKTVYENPKGSKIHLNNLDGEYFGKITCIPLFIFA